MSDTNPYRVGSFDNSSFDFAANADESARATFIRRTYTHLAGAIFAFVAIEALLFTLVPQEAMARLVGMMVGGWSWLIVLGAFMGVSWLATSWANSGQSKGMQYAGLTLYVVAEAVIFLPLMYIAITVVGDPSIPITAGFITLLAVGGMTAFVFMTRVDLSWMGKYLALAFLVAIGAIVCGTLFQVSMFGLLFSAIMVGLACASILYQTSNILHQYHTEQYVAASLALFASVALLFWYVMQIMLAFSQD